MSGIAGLASSPEQDEPGVIERMLGALCGKRGASIHLLDEQGRSAQTQRNTALALGAVSWPGEGQSHLVVDELCLVFDGYVENRSELASRLKVEINASDIRLAAHAYQRWGLAAFQLLRGGWSLMLIDHRRHRLIICRDRFGIRPLYIARSRGVICVASEPAAILASGFVERASNRRVLINYLVMGELDCGRETFFSGIESFPPGHFAVLDLASSSAEPEYRPYYELPTRQTGLDYPEYVNQLRRSFFEAVAESADGVSALGTCLTGGLDSSSITAALSLLKRNGFSRSDTGLSFGFCADSSVYGERKFIEAVAARSSRRLVALSPNREDFEQALSEALDRFDEPFTSQSIAAQSMILASAKSNGIERLLDGQCADQFLAGYQSHLIAHHANLRSEGKTRQAHELRSQFTRHLGPFPGTPNVAQPDDLTLERFRQVYRPEVMETLAPLAEAPSSSAVRAILVSSVRSSSVPALLRYLDRNASSARVEARLPFLDPRLVAIMLGAHEDYLFRGISQKYALRDAMRPYLPGIVLNRVDKIGYRPEPEWLTSSPLAAPDCLCSSAGGFEDDLFDPDGVDAFLKTPQSPSYDFLLWRIINVKAWLRRHWPS